MKIFSAFFIPHWQAPRCRALKCLGEPRSNFNKRSPLLHNAVGGCARGSSCCLHSCCAAFSCEWHVTSKGHQLASSRGSTTSLHRRRSDVQEFRTRRRCTPCPFARRKIDEDTQQRGGGARWLTHGAAGVGEGGGGCRWQLTRELAGDGCGCQPRRCARRCRWRYRHKGS